MTINAQITHVSDIIARWHGALQDPKP